MLPWNRAARALATLILSAAVTLVPVASASASVPRAGADAPQGTAARGGWNDYSCEPSAAHPRPVVLVHGTFENSVDNWFVLAPYLVRRGYCVFALDYGVLPGIPLFHGLGPLTDSAGELATFVDKVLAATGADEVDMVGHSQGGSMPRYYLKNLGGAAKVNALIGIAPSNHGSDFNSLTNLLPYFPGAEKLFYEDLPALGDQVTGSAFLTALNAGGDTVPGVTYTVIATRYDEVVTPYRSQFLTGPNVRNVLVQDLCPFDLSEHALVGITDRIAFHEVANALDPAHATRTTCASAHSR